MLKAKIITIFKLSSDQAVVQAEVISQKALSNKLKKKSQSQANPLPPVTNVVEKVITRNEIIINTKEVKMPVTELPSIFCKFKASYRGAEHEYCLLVDLPLNYNQGQAYPLVIIPPALGTRMTQFATIANGLKASGEVITVRIAFPNSNDETSGSMTDLEIVPDHLLTQVQYILGEGQWSKGSELQDMLKKKGVAIAKNKLCFITPSMSSMLVLQVANSYLGQIKSIVLLSPIPDLKKAIKAKYSKDRDLEQDIQNVLFLLNKNKSFLMTIFAKNLGSLLFVPISQILDTLQEAVVKEVLADVGNDPDDLLPYMDEKINYKKFFASIVYLSEIIKYAVLPGFIRDKLPGSGEGLPLKYSLAETKQCLKGILAKGIPVTMIYPEQDDLAEKGDVEDMLFSGKTRDTDKPGPITMELVRESGHEWDKLYKFQQAAYLAIRDTLVHLGPHLPENAGNVGNAEAIVEGFDAKAEKAIEGFEGIAYDRESKTLKLNAKMNREKLEELTEKPELEPFKVVLQGLYERAAFPVLSTAEIGIKSLMEVIDSATRRLWLTIQEKYIKDKEKSAGKETIPDHVVRLQEDGRWAIYRKGGQQPAFIISQETELDSLGEMSAEDRIKIGLLISAQKHLNARLFSRLLNVLMNDEDIEKLVEELLEERNSGQLAQFLLLNGQTVDWAKKHNGFGPRLTQLIPAEVIEGQKVLGLLGEERLIKIINRVIEKHKALLPNLLNEIRTTGIPLIRELMTKTNITHISIDILNPIVDEINANPDLAIQVLKEIDPEILELIGKRRTMDVFRLATKAVPAYQAFLNSKALKAINNIDDYDTMVPITTKNTYISKYPLKQRCIGGVIQTGGMARSAGSTGQSTTWVNSPREMEELRRATTIGLQLLFNAQPKSQETIIISTWATGVWVTG
ncbi:MAG: hypothetical protein WC838_02350, partial [Candidatus Margulisiibacteriota bacterium]